MGVLPSWQAIHNALKSVHKPHLGVRAHSGEHDPSMDEFLNLAICLVSVETIDIAVFAVRES